MEGQAVPRSPGAFLLGSKALCGGEGNNEWEDHTQICISQSSLRCAEPLEEGKTEAALGGLEGGSELHPPSTLCQALPRGTRGLFLSHSALPTTAAAGQGLSLFTDKERRCWQAVQIAQILTSSEQGSPERQMPPRFAERGRQSLGRKPLSFHHHSWRGESQERN